MIKNILISAWVPPGHEFVLTEGAPSDSELFGVIPHSMGPDGELGPVDASGEIIPLPDADVSWRELQMGELPCGIQEPPDSRGYIQKALLMSIREVPVLPLERIIPEYQARQETSQEETRPTAAQGDYVQECYEDWCYAVLAETTPQRETSSEEGA